MTRVARLVGTEGTLGVQADVKDVSGIWKELTDNVNLMGRNLTDQVRDIAERDHRGRQRRPLARRSPSRCKGELLAAEEHDQRDGRLARLVRRPR